MTGETRHCTNGPDVDTRLAAAEALATIAHSGQVDKSGRPYRNHLERVASRLGPDTHSIIVAWLHDVIEDTEVTEQCIRSVIGESVADDVLVLTRRDGETYKDYIARVCAHGSVEVCRVKLADLHDHLFERSGYILPDSLRKRYETAAETLEARLSSG